MKVFSRLGIALFAAAALLLSGQALAQEKLTVWWVKGFYKSEDDALFEAIKKYEAKTGVKVELSQYAVQDGIPKVVAALDAGNPPDVAYIDVFDFQVTAQVGLRRQARGHQRHPHADEGPVPAEHRRDHVALQRQDEEEGVLRVPAEAADDAHPVLEGHAGRGGLQGVRHSDRRGRSTGRSGATRCSPRYRKASGKRGFAIGFPMGVDSSDSYLLVPDVHGRLQREARRRRRQGAGRRPEGEAGPRQCAARLRRGLPEGLHAAVRRRPGRTRTTTSPSTTRRS